MMAAGENLACDVLVVGGGINGAGIARDLAGRGLQSSCAKRMTSPRIHHRLPPS
jgi:glycerol-3-phosphate dehydrogenase